MKKEHLFEFDFIRTLACLIIVIYHFSASISTLNTGLWLDKRWMMTYANGNIGEITAVALFFMISGACLYLNHDFFNNKSLLDYFKKRWLSIFPAFYLVWAFIYIQNVLLYKSFFFCGKKSLILSFIGMDGYTLYLGDNYYSVGEWFLGALIIMYILFPVLVWGYKKSWIITVIPVIAGFVFFLVTDTVRISDMRNPFTCLVSFCLGMLFVRYIDLFKKKWMGLASILAAIVLLFVKLPINQIVCMIMLAFCFLTSMFSFGSLLKRITLFKKLFAFISGITYEMFLIHHVLINKTVTYFTMTELSMADEVLLLIGIFAATVFFAYILKVVVNHFVSNRGRENVSEVLK